MTDDITLSAEYHTTLSCPLEDCHWGVTAKDPTVAKQYRYMHYHAEHRDSFARFSTAWAGYLESADEMREREAGR